MHNKRNNQDTKEATYEIMGSMCKPYIQEGINYRKYRRNPKNFRARILKMQI